MKPRCSIGIVTYLGRYETFFKPLVRKLDHLFPDYDIIVYVNGHYDLEKQIRYLQEVTAFLQQYPSIRYLTNVDHQPLARGWNWLVLMAYCDKVLILNDDVSFDDEFRHQLERREAISDVCTLNDSWSHFIIGKEVIRKVGWFDERFQGVGNEDYDYVFRLALSGTPLQDISLPGLHNFVAASQDQAGWHNISGVVDGKYAKINRDFFREKWSVTDDEPPKGQQDDAVHIKYKQDAWYVRLQDNIDPVPIYYPYSELVSKTHEQRVGTLRLMLVRGSAYTNYFYHELRRHMGKFMYSLLGEKWIALRRKSRAR